MTVLVVIGLISSAVILTLPGEKPAIETYSKTMVKEINGAAQTSLLTGETTALGLSETAYAVLIYREGQWQSNGARELPEGTKLSFEKEGANVRLSDKMLPLGVFEPTGTANVFTVTLRSSDGRYDLISAGDGRLVLSRAS